MLDQLEKKDSYQLFLAVHSIDDDVDSFKRTLEKSLTLIKVDLLLLHLT